MQCTRKREIHGKKVEKAISTIQTLEYRWKPKLQKLEDGMRTEGEVRASKVQGRRHLVGA